MATTAAGLTTLLPLAALDCESTGTNAQVDRVIEVAVMRLAPVAPDGVHKISTLATLINPGLPIPAEASAVHGISDADVATAPSFGQIAAELRAILDGATLVAFNAAFDLTLLEAEFARIGMPAALRSGRSIIDPMRIFHRKEPRDLAAAVRLYCGREHEGAHRALADVSETLEVLRGQLARYEDLPRDPEGLAAWCRDPSWIDPDGRIVWRRGEATWNVGKNAGRTLRDLAEHDSSFLWWVLGRDFSSEVKTVVRDALSGRFPAR